MAGDKKNWEVMFYDILEHKKSSGMDDDSLLTLLGLVNLMMIVDIINEDSPPDKSKSCKSGVPVPMGMFIRPQVKEQE